MQSTIPHSRRHTHTALSSQKQKLTYLFGLRAQHQGFAGRGFGNALCSRSALLVSSRLSHGFAFVFFRLRSAPPLGDTAEATRAHALSASAALRAVF